MIERRRYHRHNLAGSQSRWWTWRFPKEQRPIIDLSFGGICFESDRPLKRDLILELWLSLLGPIKDTAFVTVVVRWCEPDDQGWLCGAEFVKSNKPWLGPEQLE